MVRERQRHQPAPGDAAAYTTENKAVSEVGLWRRGCVHHRLVPVGAPKRFEPSRRVEHGSSRVPLHHLGPARIPKGIDPIHRRHWRPTVVGFSPGGSSRLVWAALALRVCLWELVIARTPLISFSVM